MDILNHNYSFHRQLLDNQVPNILDHSDKLNLDTFEIH